MSDYYFTLTERFRQEELRQQAAEARLASEFVRANDATRRPGRPPHRSVLRWVGDALGHRHSRRTA